MYEFGGTVTDLISPLLIIPRRLLFFVSCFSLSMMHLNARYHGVVKLLSCKNLAPILTLSVSMMVERVFVPNSSGTCLLYLLSGITRSIHGYS